MLGYSLRNKWLSLVVGFTAAESLGRSGLSLGKCKIIFTVRIGALNVVLYITILWLPLIIGSDITQCRHYYNQPLHVFLTVLAVVLPLLFVSVSGIILVIFLFIAAYKEKIKIRKLNQSPIYECIGENLGGTTSQAIDMEENDAYSSSMPHIVAYGSRIPRMENDADGSRMPHMEENVAYGSRIPHMVNDGDGSMEENDADYSIILHTEESDADGIDGSRRPHMEENGLRMPHMEENDADGSRLPYMEENDADGSRLPYMMENDADGSRMPHMEQSDADGSRMPHMMENDVDGSSTSQTQIML